MGRGKEPSWEMKKAIIDLAAKQGPKPIVIQRDLDRMVGSGGPLEGESVPNFRTIKRVLKKFQMMDREIIVSEFKPYVLKLRNDFDRFWNRSETKVLKDFIEEKLEHVAHSKAKISELIIHGFRSKECIISAMGHEIGHARYTGIA